MVFYTFHTHKEAYLGPCRTSTKKLSEKTGFVKDPTIDVWQGHKYAAIPPFVSLLFTEAVVRRCSVKKVFIKTFTKFTGKHLYQSFFLNKVVGLRFGTLFKKRLWYRCFHVNYAKFLRTPIFIEHLRLLLFLMFRDSCWRILVSIRLKGSVSAIWFDASSCIVQSHYCSPSMATPNVNRKSGYKFFQADLPHLECYRSLFTSSMFLSI